MHVLWMRVAWVFLGGLRLPLQLTPLFQFHNLSYLADGDRRQGGVAV